MTIRRTLLAFMVLLATALSATAQEVAPDSLQPLVEQARKDGMTVVIMSPAQPDAPAAAPAPGARTGAAMTDVGLRLREEVRRLVIHSPNIPDRIIAALERASPDGKPWWIIWPILVAVLGILAGILPARYLGIWMRDNFRPMFVPNPRDRADKVGYLLFRAMSLAIAVSIMFVCGMVVAIIFDTGHEPSRQTIFVIIVAWTFWQMLRRVILFNLFAPDAPSHRMINLDNDEALRIFRDLRWAIAIPIVAFALAEWMRRLDLDGDAHKLLLILTTLLGAMVIGFITIKHRRAIHGVVLGAGDEETKPFWRKFLADTWHLWALLYITVAVAVSVVRLLLGLPSATTLIAAPAIGFIGAVAAFGILLIVIDRIYDGREKAHRRKVAAAIAESEKERRIEEQARAEAMREGMDGEIVLVNEAAKPTPHPEMTYRPVFKPLLEQSAGIIVTIVSIGFVLGSWDVQVGERGHPLTAFLGTLVVIFTAWFLYRAVALYVDRKLDDEGAVLVGGAPHDGDDGGLAHGATRLGTLLPLLRNVLSVAIVAIAGMIILSNAGVDIAPLFAGAGVVGLAVGFGAQALIRDIFSGGFFLFDDAFRKGEYIELGNIRGTVEKISLRSFQLRHHNGPLHTIPFGEIKQLTNYSRDWVIMKLPLRVTYDTDVEKVRKLIKKLGQELLTHKDVGHLFLQPLKSQGVVQMDDSALVLRVKFMTRPGDQWQTRKVVYQSVQDVFQREGIRFANREVTVRIHGDGPPSSDAVRQAASAAARDVIDRAATQKPVMVDDR